MMLAIEARSCRGITGFRAQRGADENRAVHEQGRHEPHLDPEGDGREVRIQIREHQEYAADDDDGEAREHDIMNAVQMVDFARDDLRGTAKRAQGRPVGRQRAAASAHQSADVRE